MVERALPVRLEVLLPGYALQQNHCEAVASRARVKGKRPAAVAGATLDSAPTRAGGLCVGVVEILERGFAEAQTEPLATRAER